jgi:hypothetical protein
MTPNTETYLIIFVALTGLAVLLQACILLAIFISLRKAAKSFHESSTDLKATILPMVHQTRDLIDRISPQVVTVTSGLADLTSSLKKESAGIKVNATEIMERVNVQVKRIDLMLTHGLNNLEKASTIMENTVAAPVRQVNGVVAAIKAVVNSYRSGNTTSQR